MRFTHHLPVQRTPLNLLVLSYAQAILLFSRWQIFGAEFFCLFPYPNTVRACRKILQGKWTTVARMISSAGHCWLSAFICATGALWQITVNLESRKRGLFISVSLHHRLVDSRRWCRNSQSCQSSTFISGFDCTRGLFLVGNRYLPGQLRFL